METAAIVITIWAAFVTGALVGIQWGRFMRGTTEAEKGDYAYLEGIYAGQKAFRDDVNLILFANEEERTRIAEIPARHPEDFDLPGAEFFSGEKDG